MRLPVEILRQSFPQRVRSPRLWSWVSYGASRVWLALALALGAGLLVVLAAAFGPPWMGVAATDPQNVADTFARLVSAVATAATIAVSVAALTLSREMKGVDEQEDRHKADYRYRDRVRQRAGLEGTPIALGAFAATVLRNVADATRRVRQAAGEQALETRVEGVSLREYLAALEAQAVEVADRAEAKRQHPHDMFDALVDFETEITSHLSHAFGRSPDLSEEAREALRDLSACVRDAVIGIHYSKTLDIQWGLSRMASSIAVTSLPAIVGSAFMVLLYDDGMVDALGVMGAAVLVGGALAVAMLPITAFVSYILRFLFHNEHTLPTEGFVLGPESWAITQSEDALAPRDRGRIARRPGGS